MSVMIEKEDVYIEYCEKVRRYITGKISNPHDVEDLVSCVFLKVCEKSASFDEKKASVSTWVYTITRNTVIDYYRASKRLVELPENLTGGADEIDSELIGEETLERLADALEQLDQRSHNMIILKYYNHLTLKAVAERMGMSYANAKIVHSRALSRLKNLLGD